MSQTIVPQKCLCPDDCNCRRDYRTNYCGCQEHEPPQEIKSAWVIDDAGTVIL